MPRKPTGVAPTWATDGGADIVDPGSTKQDLGWEASDRPPAGFLNWWKNKVGAFVSYLDAIADIVVYNNLKVLAPRLDDAIYDGDFFDVSAETGLPLVVSFGDLGFAMYVADAAEIYQYTLGTPYDVTTASYASKSYDPTAQVTVTHGVVFDASGATMLVSDTDGTVYQYTLSTAWDVSTASYASKSLDASAQSTAARNIAFGNAGGVLYLAGSTNAEIYQYTLGTPYDLTGAVYASKLLDVSTQESTPRALAPTSDGEHMFVVGDTSDTIYQYTMSTAWDLSTASYASKSLDISSEETNPWGLAISSNNGRLFLVGNSGEVYQYYISKVVG